MPIILQQELDLVAQVGASLVNEIPKDRFLFSYLLPSTRSTIASNSSYGYLTYRTGLPAYAGAPWFPIIEDPEKLMVRYYATFTDTTRSRTTESRAGRFFGNMDISERAIELSIDKLRSIFMNPTVEFAITAAEIGEVYYRGPNSCMASHKGCHGEFSIPSLYAYPHERTDIVAGSGNNLAVAYIRGDNGRFASRALVDIEKMQFNRIYGDIPLLLAGLSKLGYKQNTEILLNVPLSVKQFKGRYACPYLDSKAYCRVKVGRDSMALAQRGKYRYTADKFLERIDDDEDEYREDGEE